MDPLINYMLNKYYKKNPVMVDNITNDNYKTTGKPLRNDNTRQWKSRS